MKADNDVTLSCNNFESPELIQHQGATANEEMVIYINRVYYGRDDTHECGEREQDEYCQVSASQQMCKLLECNGQSECTHMVYPHAITCPSSGDTPQDAHFLRVDYQCIKGENGSHMNGGTIHVTKLKHQYFDNIILHIPTKISRYRTL